jgi:hypothetical protein
MERNHTCKLFPACMLGLVAILLSTAPSSAQADNSDRLFQDISAYHTECDNVTSSQASLVHQCANKKAQLIARQQKLGLSANDPNELLTPPTIRGLR